MGKIEDKLAELGLVLPAPLRMPGNNRTSGVRVGNLLFISGHGADLLETDTVAKHGKIGADLTLDDGYATARALALKMLATVKDHSGDLEAVKRVVKILGMVNASPDFEHHNKVINGASDLLFEVFGPTVGCHARSSIGVSGLVANQCVEVEGIFELHDSRME